MSILHAAQTSFDISAPCLEGMRIVAHMGLFDKGKTWLINKMYGTSLPSGKLHETLGLCMVYVPEKRFLIIDTKGLHSPVSYRTKGAKQLVDASQTEVFLFELVSRIAHYIVFVVNDFTWPEQRHIVQLHQKYVQTKRDNQLIVAHNLRTTRSVAEAEELFWKQVSSKYDGVHRQELGGLIFTVEERPRIHHIGFAQESSPAGTRFNNKNKAHLLQLLDQLESVGERRRSAVSLLESTFSALLPDFVYLESASDGRRHDGSALEVAAETMPSYDAVGVHVPGIDSMPVSPGSIASMPVTPTLTTARSRASGRSPGPGELEPDRELDPGTYEHTGSLVVKVPAGLRVCMKAEGVFSEFCELVAQDITFKPPLPNVYEQRHKDKTVRLVEFEIPGVLRKNITLTRGNQGYTVNMTRTKEYTVVGYSGCLGHSAPRHPTGTFSFDCFFDDGQWELDGGREAITHEHGILRVRLKQALQTQMFSMDDL